MRGIREWEHGRLVTDCFDWWARKMIVVTTLLALCALGLGTVFVRRGALSWRGRAPFAPWAWAFVDKGTRAGAERALLVLGVFHCFLGTLIGLVGCLNAEGVMGGPHPPPLPVALAVVLLVLLVGTVATAWTAIAIVWFNRPKFLVPPHLRDQPGTMSVRRRRPAAR